MADNEGLSPQDSGAESGDDSTPPDPIKNLKAEFDRKTQNLVNDSLETKRMLQEALNLLTARSTPQATPQPEEDMVALAVNDPARFADKVVRRATEAASSAVAQQTQRQTEAQQVVASLSADYPELVNQGSDLAQRATAIHQSLPEAQRGSAIAIRASIREAAAELGVLPVSKRQKNAPTADDSFTLARPSGGGSPPSRQPKDEVDPKTLAVLELMKVKVDDKVKKELSRISKRNFSKYRGRE